MKIREYKKREEEEGEEDKDEEKVEVKDEEEDEMVKSRKFLKENIRGGAMIRRKRKSLMKKH